MADVLTMVARLQNETQAGFSQIKKDIETITHGSPLKQLAAGLANLGKSLLPFTRVVRDALTPSLANLGITSLTVSGAIGGLYYGMQKVAQSAIQMRVVADLSGFSEETVQKAVHVARGMGISQEQVSSMLLNFGKLNQQLSGGPNKEPIGEMKAHIENLEQRGEKGKELARKIREHGREFQGSNPEGLLALVADPVQGIFNMRGRLELMPMFQFPLSMTDQWNQRMKEAPKQTAAAKKATEDYNEQWNQFVEAGEEFGRAFFNVFGPPMTALLDAIADKLNDILLVLKLLEKAVDWILPGWLKDLIGWKGDLFGIPNLPDVVSRGLSGVGGGGLGGLAGRMPIPGVGNTSNPQGPPGHSPVRTGFKRPIQGALAKNKFGLRDAFPSEETQREVTGGGQSKTGWFANYQDWIDKGDKAGSNRLGIPEGLQGIALPNPKIKSGLGGWYHLTDPATGKTFLVQQTDYGPHTKTGRQLDIAASAADAMGYRPKGESAFPTDKGTWKWAAADAPVDPNLRNREVGTQIFYNPEMQGPPQDPKNPYPFSSINSNPFSNPMEVPPSSEGMDKALWYRSGAPKIESSGTVTVDVTAPPGTKVDAEGGGMFDTTTINRKGGRLSPPPED